MVMVFYQFKPIWVNLDTRTGQGQVKNGRIVKFLILKYKDMVVIQNVPRNPMVPVFFSTRDRTPGNRVLLNNVTIRRNVV